MNSSNVHFPYEPETYWLKPLPILLQGSDIPRRPLQPTFPPTVGTVELTSVALGYAKALTVPAIALLLSPLHSLVAGGKGSSESQSANCIELEIRAEGFLV